MTFKNINKSAQSILEYFILTTVVAVVVLFFSASSFFKKQNAGDPDGIQEIFNEAFEEGIADILEF